ncbi:unnamed protein product [Polarella glacialis]|uniref:Uncharacterized protein n=1 Tax=Polarella glacialis TaxID=89957 RepID=A0A813G856_POLGL|nr:unnamed protein product [Polarella glacialis]
MSSIGFSTIAESIASPSSSQGGDVSDSSSSEPGHPSPVDSASRFFARLFSFFLLLRARLASCSAATSSSAEAPIPGVLRHSPLGMAWAALLVRSVAAAGRLVKTPVTAAATACTVRRGALAKIAARTAAATKAGPSAFAMAYLFSYYN